jgi:hypothetical protein
MGIIEKKTASFTAVTGPQTKRWLVGLRRDFYQKYLHSMNQFLTTNTAGFIKMAILKQLQELWYGAK